MRYLPSRACALPRAFTPARHLTLPPSRVLHSRLRAINHYARTTSEDRAQLQVLFFCFCSSPSHAFMSE